MLNSIILSIFLIAMNPPATDGSPHGGSRFLNILKKPFLPAVPRRYPEAGSIVYHGFLWIEFYAAPAMEVKELRIKISILFFPAFQLFLEFDIRIRHGIYRNRKHRYNNEPERVRSGKNTGTGNNSCDNE